MEFKRALLTREVSDLLESINRLCFVLIKPFNNVKQNGYREGKSSSHFSVQQITEDESLNFKRFRIKT